MLFDRGFCKVKRTERDERREGVAPAAQEIERTRGRFVVLTLIVKKVWKPLLRPRGATASLLLIVALSRPAFGAGEADARRDPTVEAVERVMPSVVNIGTETIVESNEPFEQMLREFWGPYYRRRQPDAHYSLGSGVIIDENGYVLTCLHVVQRASRVWVTLADGRQFEAQPKFMGDPRIDVALLKLITDRKSVV